MDLMLRPLLHLCLIHRYYLYMILRHHLQYPLIPGNQDRQHHHRHQQTTHQEILLIKKTAHKMNLSLHYLLFHLLLYYLYRQHLHHHHQHIQLPLILVLHQNLVPGFLIQKECRLKILQEYLYHLRLIHR